MFTEMDRRAIAHARALAADAVQSAGHGHPGTAMALAPAAYLLFQKHLRHNPADADWIGRDRFVLSAGHSSLTLYTQLLYSGYGLQLSDLQSFRRHGSLTPAHPEYGHTVGVETTTGPLGQGVGMGVGLALAAQHVRAVSGCEMFDPTVWVLAGDGCLQEGVSAEASSLAGHLGLGNLVLIYDDNRISIDGDTALSFSEDVSARYRSYGWNVLDVNAADDGDIDLESLDSALSQARALRTAPSLVRMRTTIAWPAPNARNTAKSHGSALGAEEVAATKRLLGLDPSEQFALPNDVHAHTLNVRDRGARFAANWAEDFQRWRSENAEAAKLFDALFSTDVDDVGFPEFESGGMLATRQASGRVLNSIAGSLPMLIGGSADLGESNQTVIEGADAIGPHDYRGRNIHYGVREHGMGAVMNGLALFGLRPYGGTFLVFSDYMRGAVRLSALMDVPVTYVWTHDSIGLGEDGPTHQPVEHLWALRAIPNLAVVRPCDANETAAAWREILRNAAPTGLVLSRQATPTVTSPDQASAVGRGAYVLRDVANPKALVIATGTEVALALEAAERLDDLGIATRVISAPCLEWFEAQAFDYKESVLPEGVTNRVSIEAGSTVGWYRYVRTAIGIDRFGASSAPAQLYHDNEITAEAVVRAVQAQCG